MASGCVPGGSRVITGLIHMDTTPLRDMDPELARKILLADLVLLGGTLLPGGAKFLNYDTGAWATDILLIDLMPTSDDLIDGGDGEDILFGQRGSDTLRGGGQNDLIFGDGATNVLPFQTQFSAADRQRTAPYQHRTGRGRPARSGRWRLGCGPEHHTARGRVSCRRRI